MAWRSGRSAEILLSFVGAALRDRGLAQTTKLAVVEFDDEIVRKRDYPWRKKKKKKAVIDVKMKSREKKV